MYNRRVCRSVQDKDVATRVGGSDPSNESYSRKEVFNAALHVAKRSGPFKGKPDEANSRASESSFILIGKEGEILSRVKLELVYQQCRINRRKSRQGLETHQDQQESLQDKNKILLVRGIKKRYLVVGATVVAILAIVSSCHNNYDKRSRVLSRERLDRVVKEWDADLNVASSTARIALSPPVMRLRDYAQSVDKTPVHDCFDPARSSLREYMDATVRYFVRFMADADADISEDVEKAANLRREYEKRLEACK